MAEPLKCYAILQERLQAGEACVVATLVDITGSAPQNVGARVLVTSAGLLWGTIGGGKIEARVIAEAQEMLTQSSAYRFRQWNLQSEIGMTCGGVVRVYFETYRPQGWTIAVFGAGHVAQALIPILTTLSCRVLCFDSRPEWIARLPVHPALQAQVIEDLTAQVEHLPQQTFLLSLTMGHAHDRPILQAALERWHTHPAAFAFLGVMGSPAKAGKLRQELRQAGCDPELLARLHCPVGLPLGNNTPAEIAISIAAQLLQVRDQLAGDPKWGQPGYVRMRAQEAADESI